MVLSAAGAGLANLNVDGRLLLGTVGWQRDDWLSAYYPVDLPAEWRLAYYANDCGCVLLRSESWLGMDREALEESLDEAEGRLVYFLEAPPGWSSLARDRLSLFAARRAVLLTERPDPAQAQLPQWGSQGPGAWVDRDSGAGLSCWSLGSWDLRALRNRAGKLVSHTHALILDGPAASPARVAELRTLLELLGRA
jgi:hypothetical protein